MRRWSSNQGKERERLLQRNSISFARFQRQRHRSREEGRERGRGKGGSDGLRRRRWRRGCVRAESDGGDGGGGGKRWMEDGT